MRLSEKCLSRYMTTYTDITLKMFLFLLNICLRRRGESIKSTDTRSTSTTSVVQLLGSMCIFPTAPFVRRCRRNWTSSILNWSIPTMLKVPANVGAFFFSKKTCYYVVSPLRTKVLNAGISGRLDRYGDLSRGPAAHKTEKHSHPTGWFLFMLAVYNSI